MSGRTLPHGRNELAEITGRHLFSAGFFAGDAIYLPYHLQGVGQHVNVAHPDRIGGGQPFNAFLVVFFLIAQDQIGLELVNQVKIILLGAAHTGYLRHFVGRMDAEFGAADYLRLKLQVKQ
jgi:hypothetical protein